MLPSDAEVQGGMDRIFTAWVVVRRADDVPGQWVSHCLDYDVVSQGDSLDHAMKMVVESTTIVVADDVSKGRDPMSRRAPEACWEELWAVVRTGDRVVGFAEIDEDHVAIAAAQLEIHVRVLTSQLPLAESSFSAPVTFSRESRLSSADAASPAC
jgi:hypothetical protein